MNGNTARKHSGNDTLPLWLRISFLADAEAKMNHKFHDGSIFTPETPEAWFEVGELERRFGKWSGDDVKPRRNDEIKRAIETAVTNGLLWYDSEPTCLKPVVV